MNTTVPINFNDITQDINLDTPEYKEENIEITEHTPTMFPKIKLEIPEETLQIPIASDDIKEHEITTTVDKSHQPVRQSNPCTPLLKAEPSSFTFNVEREIKEELLQQILDSSENEETNEAELQSARLVCTTKHNLTENETLHENNIVIITDAPNALRNNELAHTPSAKQSHSSSTSEPQVTKQQVRSDDSVTQKFVTLPLQSMPTTIQSPGGSLTVTVKFVSQDLTPTQVHWLARAAKVPGKHVLQLHLKALLVKYKLIPNVLEVDCSRKINEGNPTLEMKRQMMFHLEEVVGINETEIKAIYRVKQNNQKPKAAEIKIKPNNRKSKEKKNIKPRQRYKTVVYTSQDYAKATAKTSVKKVNRKSTDTAMTTESEPLELRNTPKFPLQSLEDGTEKQSVVPRKYGLTSVLKEGISEKFTSNPERKRKFDPDGILVNTSEGKISRLDQTNCGWNSTELPTNETRNARSMPLLQTDDLTIRKNCDVVSTLVERSLNGTLQSLSTRSQLQEYNVVTKSDAGSSVPDTSVQLDRVKVVAIKKPTQEHKHAEVDLSSQTILIPLTSMTPLNQELMLGLLPKDLSTPKEDTYLHVPITSIPVLLQFELRKRLCAKMTAMTADPRPKPGDQEERLQFRELREIMSRDSGARVPVPKRKTVDKSWTGYRWACSLCPDLVFETAKDLREHSKAGHGKCFTMMCTDCDQVSESFAKFVFHVAYHRRYLRPYCPYCNSKVELSDYRDHVQTHQKNCHACGEFLGTRAALKLHVSKYAGATQERPKKKRKKPKQPKRTA